MDNALIVIDMQNDFVRKIGALYVPGAEEIIFVIQGLLEKARDTGLPIVFTTDWHEENDAEFHAESWPVHCVKGSKGAEIINGLSVGDAFVVKQSGHDKFLGTGLKKFLGGSGVKRLFFTGVATEYCVKDTVLAARDHGFEVFVARDAIRSVDYRDGLAALREMEEKGVSVVDSKTMNSLISESNRKL